MPQFDDLEILRTRARAVRSITSPLLSPVVLKEITRHRESILSCSDPELLEDYINRATEAECLCALSEMSLGGPLNDAYYRIFTYLATKIFRDLDLELPHTVDPEEGGLTDKEQAELDGLRLGIRMVQKRSWGLH